MGDISNTQYFKAVQEDKKLEVGEVLREVYEALTEKGYNPINQIVGYIMSGDPTYITSYMGLFAVEGAQAAVQPPLPLELDIVAHHIHDIGAAGQFLNIFVWDHFGIPMLLL